MTGPRRDGARTPRSRSAEDVSARFVIAVLCDVDDDRRDLRLVEAWMRALRRLEAARHKPGADEEQERHRHLRDDQARPQPSARRAAGRGVGVDD